MSGKHAMTGADSSGNDVGIEEIPEWQQRLDERMAAFKAKKDAEKAERAQMKRGRDWWLPRRHAARLAANRIENAQQ
jgi:hypothetical protein